MNSKFNVIHRHFLQAIAKYCHGSLLLNFSEDLNLFLEDVYSYILKQNKFDIKKTKTYFFKRKIKNSGLLKELRDREYYEKPSIKKRNKRKKRQLRVKYSD